MTNEISQDKPSPGDPMPSTGIKRLDNDIRFVLESEAAGTLSTQCKPFADHSLSLDALQAAVPEPVFRLTLALWAKVGFELLLEDIPEASRPVVAAARDCIVRYVLDLESHPALQEAGKTELRKLRQKKEDEDEPLRLDTISSIGHVPTYTGDPKALRPGIRAAFRNSKGKLLLDSMLWWDDILFVARAMLEICSEEMNDAASLHEAKILKIDEDEKAQLGKKLTEIRNALLSLDGAAKNFGIGVQAEAFEDGRK
jgi:hypothetical protein